MGKPYVVYHDGPIDWSHLGAIREMWMASEFAAASQPQEPQLAGEAAALHALRHLVPPGFRAVRFVKNASGTLDMEVEPVEPVKQIGVRFTQSVGE